VALSYFNIAIIDILNSDKSRRLPDKDLGVVPLGTPLIASPAVLTTSLIIIPKYGIIASIVSIFANILLVGLIFFFSDALIKVLGETGAKALSKITSLLLSAIGIMMIRSGIMQFL